MHAFFKSGAVELSIILRVTVEDMMVKKRNQTQRGLAVGSHLY